MGKGKNPAGGKPPEELREQAGRIVATLHRMYPKVETALHFRNPFELLIATILSAQCTDARVNEVTPVLFGRYPDARALAAADPGEVEVIVRTTGFYRQKTKAIIGCARGLVEGHGGQVPESIEGLTELPGVGRKTANMVRAFAMGQPGLIVETHFKRVVARLGLTAQTNPDKIEFEMAELLPSKEWTPFSNGVIWHGRRICVARKPQCEICPLRPDCDYGRATLTEIKKKK